jgi:hypothetical protein
MVAYKLLAEHWLGFPNAWYGRCFRDAVPVRENLAMVSVLPSLPAHPFNWWWGWSMVLAAFVTGAALGLFFYRADFLGGYASFSRRMVRLGHIALAALGMMNVVYSLSPWPVTGTVASRTASMGFAIGGITMPAVCFLAGWKPLFRHAFSIPVTALVVAVLAVLCGGLP